jgi:hybrid cluster-associated redox disulfide protein
MKTVISHKAIKRRVNLMVTKDMTIGEVVRTYPDKIETLMDFGMGCVGCPASQAETIEQAAMVHGLDLEELLEALNK